MKDIVRSVSVAVLLSTALAGPSAFAGPNYPPGGNVTGVTVSKASVVVGENLSFKINGNGKCGVQLFGFPNAISANARNSGPLPLTLSTSITQPGTFTVYVDTVKEPTNPMWCTGTASVQVMVHAAPVEPSTKPAGVGAAANAQGTIEAQRNVLGATDRTLPYEVATNPINVTGFGVTLPSSIQTPPITVTGFARPRANAGLGSATPAFDALKK